MRGFLNLLLVGLAVCSIPLSAAARSGAPWWDQVGEPGKGGLTGAGGGDRPGAGLETWNPEDAEGLRPAARPALDPDDEDNAPEDRSSQELSEEKEAEASFLLQQKTTPPHRELELPTDFYQDPLKSVQHSMTLPLEEIDLAAFDLPITINEEVASWIEFFLTKGRRFYTGWLARSTRYIPLMEEALSEEGVPRDLVYVAMIESGFAAQATSPAGAAGIWQLMLPTGRAYGLRVDAWVDERRDPEKASRAAVRHLRDLYDRFGDWYLALAAYNAGSGKIGKSLERTGARDFWALARTGQLRPETRNYVPKLLAAAIIAKNPDRFGFLDIEYDDVILYDNVQVAESTDLELIADRIGVDSAELAGLNPELRRRRTPPGLYDVKLPPGTSALFEANFRDVEEERLVYRRHRVRAGQTLVSIARYYGVTVEELKRMNRLKSSRLKTGASLLVPQQEEPLAPFDPEGDSLEATEIALQQGGGSEERTSASSERIVYEVRSGDTVWSIAKRYTVTVEELMRSNGLNGRKPLQVGQRLDIPRR